MSEQPRTDPFQPLFFGSVEALAFMSLFLTLLLPPQTAPFLWIAIPLMRFVVLALRTLPLHFPKLEDARQGPGSLLRQGWAYQIPFWGAGLLFPLQSGQTKSAACGLLLQLGLVTFLLLAARKPTRLSALALVYLATLGWLCLWHAKQIWWLAGAALGLALVLKRGRRPAFASGRCSPQQCLALGTMWLAVWVLPPLCQRSPSHWLLGFHLLTVVAVVFTIWRRHAGKQSEAEESTPAKGAARDWLMRRQSVTLLLPWAAFCALVGSSPGDYGLLALLFFAWWRGSVLASRFCWEQNTPLGWIACESTLIWFFSQGYQGETLAGSALIWALFLLAPRGAQSALPKEGQGWPGLELRLRRELRRACPGRMAARVLEETGAVKLDDHLTAPAPEGFRQRLLERLRQNSEGD